MRHWLFKSEPSAWSWQQMKAAGKTPTEWTGVRNYQARNNMRSMALGDRGFFYHSNEGLAVVGVVEIAALAHVDSTADNPTWECVDIRAVADMPKPVALAAIKVNPKLAAMALVANSRLSVQPVTDEEWAEVCAMGGWRG